MRLGLGIGLGFKVNAILQAFAQKYDPLVVFGSDLVTYYGNSVEELFAQHRKAWEDSPELVTNGTFDSNVNSWTPFGSALVTWASGQMRIEANSGNIASQEVPTIAGRMYRVSWTAIAGTGIPRLQIGTAVPNGSLLDPTDGAGSKTAFFTASGATAHLQFATSVNTNGLTAFFDNISVREVDLTKLRLYQDSAGTTPVTAIEQFVGLVLDQSQRLVLGPELVTNGDFSNGTTGWTVGSGSNAATLSVTAGVLRATSTTTFGRFYPASPLTTVAGRWYQVSFDVVAFASGNSAFRVGTFLNGADVLPTQTITGAGRKTFVFLAITSTTYLWFENGATSGGYQEVDNVSTRELPGNHLSQTTATARPRLTRRVNLLSATDVLATQDVTTLAASHVLTFSGAGSVTLSGTATGTYSAGTHTITTTAGTLTLTVSGDVLNADIRLATFATSAFPPYQRVTSATDYDEVGFPARLRLDGVDDFLTSGQLPLSGISSLSALGTYSRVSSGRNDALWSTNPLASGFAAIVSSSDGDRLRVDLLDSTKKIVAAVPGGTNFVATAILDTTQASPSDEIIGRVNGVAGSISTTGAGVSTTMSNAPMEVGRWGGSVYLLGDIFALPMIVKRLMTPGELASAERAFGKSIGVLQ